jgi:hypothetical protein
VLGSYAHRHTQLRQELAATVRVAVRLPRFWKLVGWVCVGRQHKTTLTTVVMAMARWVAIATLLAAMVATADAADTVGLMF